MVPNPVPALLGGREQPADLRLTEVVPSPDMGMRGPVVVTFYIYRLVMISVGLASPCPAWAPRVILFTLGTFRKEYH